MKLVKLIIAFFIFINLNFVNAQKIIEAEIKEALPQSVIDKIENTTDITSVFSVGNDEHFSGQVIKANEIVFSENARLTFDNIDAPWIVLVADKIKFQNPNRPARITFSSTNISEPSKASNGSNGANANGRNGRHGKPGANGHTGTTGITGKTKNLPHIYIVTKELTSPNGMPAFAPLAILGNGLRGGKGGKGGNGGNGGKGYSGLKAASGVLDCKRGAGNGGRGGNAGLGGKGGQGGKGGNGVSVTIISTSIANEAFSYIQLLNSGGIGGPGGSPGHNGNSGEGGGMGRGTGHCSGGRSGSRGSIPNPSNLGYGSEGTDGSKGNFLLVTTTIPDLKSIL